MNDKRCDGVHSFWCVGLMKQARGMSQLKHAAMKCICKASVVDVHMYMAGRAEERMNQMHHRNTVRWLLGQAEGDDRTEVMRTYPLKYFPEGCQSRLTTSINWGPIISHKILVGRVSWARIMAICPLSLPASGSLRQPGNDEVLDASGERQAHHETSTFINLYYSIDLSTLYMHREL